MDIELFKDQQIGMPVFQQRLLDGLAYGDLHWAKRSVDELIRCAVPSFPDEFDFKESTICDPKKAYKVMTTGLSRSGREPPAVDLAINNVYLVEYIFTYKGKELYPRYFNLPFCEPGGLFTIAGKQFAISSVLMDPCFSVGEDYVFIRMSRAPVTFRRVMHSINVDNAPGAATKLIVYSKLHHKGGSNDKKRESDTIHVGRVQSTMPHYLFCRYGVYETFRKFARTDVIITTEKELLDKPLDVNKYVLVRSSGARPMALKSKVDYQLLASPVVLAIPRSSYGKLTESLAAGFFYIVDHFPEISDPEELASDWRWKVWLGYVLWGDQLGHQKLVENVDSHLSSLDDYVDHEVRNTLREEEDLLINDIYELFVYMLVYMDDLIATKESDIGTMYGKRLVTTPYVLRDIYTSIFKCLFEITNNRKRVLDETAYNKILGKFFSPARIFDLRKTSQKAFISSVSTPGDNYFFKITSRLVMQSQTSGGAKSQNINVNDPMCHLHASSAEAGNHLLLPKNCPLAKVTINPTVMLDSKNTIMPKPHMKAVIEHIDDAIHRY